jgi:uncharacterized phiE125 gp8 family phage protein
MMLRLIESSSTLALSLEEARQHIRRTDTHEDDALIKLYVKAAQDWVEKWAGISLIEQTWDYYLDEFPDIVSGNIGGRSIRIPKPPLLEIVGMFLNDGTEITDFSVDYSMPNPRVYIEATGSWPTVTPAPNAIRIRFRSGYVDLSGSPGPDGKVPDAIKAAIAIYAATLFENRESLVTGTIASKVPWSAEELLRPYRVEDSMA